MGTVYSGALCHPEVSSQGDIFLKECQQTCIFMTCRSSAIAISNDLRSVRECVTVIAD